MKFLTLLALACLMLVIGCGAQEPQQLWDIEQEGDAGSPEDDSAQAGRSATPSPQLPEDQPWEAPKVPAPERADITLLTEEFCHKFLNDDARKYIKQAKALEYISIVEKYTPKDSMGRQVCMYNIPDPQQFSDCRKMSEMELNENAKKGRCVKNLLKLSFACGDLSGRTAVEWVEFEMYGTAVPLEGIGEKAFVNPPKGQSKIAKSGCLVDINIPLAKPDEKQVQASKGALAEIANLVDKNYVPAKAPTAQQGIA